MGAYGSLIRFESPLLVILNTLNLFPAHLAASSVCPLGCAATNGGGKTDIVALYQCSVTVSIERCATYPSNLSSTPTRLGAAVEDDMLILILFRGCDGGVANGCG